MDKRAPEDHVLLAVRDVAKGEAAVAGLRKRGLKSKLDVVQLDLASNESIIAAEKEVREKYGRLDGESSFVQGHSQVGCSVVGSYQRRFRRTVKGL